MGTSDWPTRIESVKHDLKLENLGYRIVSSSLAQIGTPVLFVDPAFHFSRNLFIHPIDYIWFNHGKDVFKAHEMSMQWILENAHRKLDLAIAKLTKPILTPIDALTYDEVLDTVKEDL